ncbi:MAG: phage tail tape measure protein, partial [Chloroflexi bacterium]|nr:phage tail tape measure protein [Chloroflexota bacterium]
MPNFIIEVALEGIDKLSPLLERAARLVDSASQTMERSLQGVQRQIDAVAQAADKSFAQVGKNMEQVGKEIEETGRKLRPLGIALTATGAALVAPAVLGTKRYAEFQAQMQAVRAVAQLTDDEFARLAQTAQTLGAETPFTAKEAAEGLTVLARAGFNTEEMLNTIAPLLQLAGAGDISLAESANIAVRSMRGMGIATEEAQRVVDVLAKAANSSTADVGDLGEGFSYVAAVARQAGMSLEETASTLAVLSDGGIVASKAGTGLQAALREMTAPSAQQRKLMQQLGLSFFDAAGNMKPLGDIVQQLNDRLGPMGAKARLGALNILFLDQGARTMSVLMGQGADKVRKMEAALDSANGEALRMQQERLKGLAGSWELFLGELDVALQFIGKLFEPALTLLVKTLERVVSTFNRLPGPVKTVVALFTTLVGALLLAAGGMVLLLGPMGALWASMGVGLTKVGVLIRGLSQLAVTLVTRVIPAIVSTIIAMGPIMWIALAIAAVIALLAFAWIKNLFGIQQKVAAFV